jgi:hypothetical protein
MRAAKHYASVERAMVPLGVDGICLDLKHPGKKPAIIINSLQSERRERFTLAHELGHVLIPWHRGSLYDDAGVFEGLGRVDQWDMESEANRFASELLMPSVWLSEIMRSNDDFGAAATLVQQKAEVSMIAGAIGLIGATSSQYIFAYCDSNFVVLNAGRSPSTLCDAPAWGKRLDIDVFDSSAEKSGSTRLGREWLFWWKFHDLLPLSEARDERGWREILEAILSDIVPDSQHKHRMRQSINGVIGSVNSRLPGCSAETLLAALVQRFDSRLRNGETSPELISHPEFRDFLCRRVEALRDMPLDPSESAAIVR